MILGLCPECSKKLNYRTKKREVKRLQKKQKENKLKKKNKKKKNYEETTSSSKEFDEESDKDISDNEKESEMEALDGSNAWTEPIEINDKTREEEIDDYLSNLLF